MSVFGGKSGHHVETTFPRISAGSQCQARRLSPPVMFWIATVIVVAAFVLAGPKADMSLCTAHVRFWG
jgi:hypothetical protein